MGFQAPGKLYMMKQGRGPHLLCYRCDVWASFGACKSCNEQDMIAGCIPEHCGYCKGEPCDHKYEMIRVPYTKEQIEVCGVCRTTRDGKVYKEREPYHQAEIV